VSNFSSLKIVSLSSKGRGLTEDKKFEVIGALPQEEVVVSIGPKRKKKRLCTLQEVVTSSAARVEPRCSHVPACGGCSLQQMDYFAQLEHKDGAIQEIFTSLIEKEGAKLHPILGCEDPWRYRNKMEFSFSQNRAGEKFLGLMLAGASGKVLNLKECYLVSKWFTAVRDAVFQWWEEEELLAYHFRSNGGHLRTLTVREAKQGVGKMVMLTVSGNPEYAVKREKLQRLVKALQQVTGDEHLSIFVQVQQIGKGRPTQFFEMLLFGPDHITERLDVEVGGKMASLNFKISPTSFFQPNTKQAELLYSRGLEMLTHLKGATLFDLYCGSATIGLSAAALAKEVVGIELNPHSVFDAQWNAEVNGIENFSIYRGDVGAVLKKEGLKCPDVVVVDPPRVGLSAEALALVGALGAKEILYISCNPKTQVDNVEALTQKGYRLKAIQPVDQFPHTPHIENICLLQKT
jgi:23S rRNA (uracil1939-C5)-methyltransferase